MDGFFYDHLGGFLGSGDKADMLDRPVDWYRRWLARGPTFSPQPYEQLAKVLRATGHSYKANDVLYTSREREREQSWELQHYGKWLGFSLLSCTIGYGLGARYFRVLWWFAGITLIGFLFLLGSIEKSNWDLFKMARASFDQVLPIVKLNEEHQKLILGNYSSWTIAYFYVQKLVGYVLGGFLGAGLAGLTQKN